MSWIGDWNRFEAALWFAFAALCAIKAARASRDRRRIFAMLAAAFAVFGVSDLIEAETGAWWRPWWLAAMKGACLVVLVAGIRKLRKNSRTRPG